MIDGDKAHGAQDEANEIFAAATKDSEERARVSATTAVAPSALTRERAVLAALAVAVPVLIVTILVSVGGLSLTSLLEAKPSAETARREAQQTLDALVIEIEAFRKDYDELPESLVEIGLPPRGQWSYWVSGKSDYRVRGTLYGQTVSFDAPPGPPKDRP